MVAPKVAGVVAQQRVHPAYIRTCWLLGFCGCFFGIYIYARMRPSFYIGDAGPMCSPCKAARMKAREQMLSLAAVSPPRGGSENGDDYISSVVGKLTLGSQRYSMKAFPSA